MRTSHRFLARSRLALALATFAAGCGSHAPAEGARRRARRLPVRLEGPGRAAEPRRAPRREAVARSGRALVQPTTATRPQTKDYSYIAIRKAQLAEASARALIAAEGEGGRRARGAEPHRPTQLSDGAEGALEHEAATSRRRRTSSPREGRARGRREEGRAGARRSPEDRGREAGVARHGHHAVGLRALRDRTSRRCCPAAMVKLNEVADALIKGNPDSNITIEGHTDSQGQRQYNMDLGQKRADAVTRPARLARRRRGPHQGGRRRSGSSDRGQQVGRRSREQPSRRDHRPAAEEVAVAPPTLTG